MNVEELQGQFGVAGVLGFEDHGGLVRMNLRTSQATATIYLQGAHLTAWQPDGFEPVIFLSRKSEFAVGKPIRGGVPIVFPWFAGDTKSDRIDRHPGPSHGFARIQDWSVKTARRVGDDFELVLTLDPTEISRALGFDRFGLQLEFLIGRGLRMRMTVKNTSDRPLRYEQAFHTYYAVGDVHEVALEGLEPTAFIDKTDAMKVKPAAQAALRFTGPTDRVYANTAAACTIHDEALRRRIAVGKVGSATTVVFNPWKELADLGEWEWHEMLAVETANTGENAVTLSPGASAVMEAKVEVMREAGR